ncbi:MAG: hypothetical protein ACXU86_10790 [Archangium sp.]
MSTSARNPWSSPGEVATVLRVDSSTVRKACRAGSVVRIQVPGAGRGRRPRWLILTRPGGLPYKPTDSDLPPGLPPEATAGAGGPTP